MKMSEVNELTEIELETKGRDLRVELFNLRIQKTTAQLEKPHRVKQLRRDVARMETRLTQLRQKKKPAAKRSKAPLQRGVVTVSYTHLTLPTKA